MSEPAGDEMGGMERRGFLRSAGAAGCGLLLGADELLTAFAAEGSTRQKEPARVRCAFLYPPSETLEGQWWSWPGNDFDAEGRQQQYTEALRGIERDLGMRIRVDDEPLDSAESVTRFIDEVNRSRLDGLLLVPFKASHFAQTDQIIRATDVPTIIFTCLGVKHGSIAKYFTKGCHVIVSLDNFDALRYAMRMVATARWMAQARILSIAGQEARADTALPHLGTVVRGVSIGRFVEEVEGTPVGKDVRALARAFKRNARRVCEPRDPEIVTAARVHFALKRLIDAEEADAVTMDCLRRGKYQPCMSFMTLRDAGTAAGCENDIPATLTLMLVQQLFGRPGFQHNPAFETEANHYFASHCTCPSKLLGPEGPISPYLLRNYAHTNDPTCVPQVLWRPGEAVTMARYVPGDAPAMLAYSGTVVKSYAMPPVGGCRTNVEITINELPRAADVKGHHDVLFYGDYARELRTFCRIYGIEATA
jgi:hypothetical protein